MLKLGENFGNLKAVEHLTQSIYFDVASLIQLTSRNVKTPRFNLTPKHISTLLIGFLMLVFYQFLDMSLTSVLEKLFRSSDGAPPWVWGIALLSVVLNILAPLVIAFWLLNSLRAKSVPADFEFLLIENLRAWGSTFLWSLLLILPGLYKWLSYSLVPYVVLFSKKYSEGQVDALEFSNLVFKKCWFKVLVLVLFFGLILPLALTTGFDGYRKIWLTPVASLLVSMLDFFILILGLGLNLYVFKTAIGEVNDELTL